jgi:EAL domain-containing protein (putative c-di-GMP-specific phosphodiesterase class I)
MNVLEKRRYEMLMRVRDFGATHKNLFSAKSLADEMIAIISSTVQELSKHAASQQVAPTRVGVT